MNSCDSMRHLYDAWRKALPGVNALVIDLPTTTTDLSIGLFRDKLERLARTLEAWGGLGIDDAVLAKSVTLQNQVFVLFSLWREKVKRSNLTTTAGWSIWLGMTNVPLVQDVF